MAKTRACSSSSGAVVSAPQSRIWPWIARFIGPVLIVVMFVALAAWSWRKWADVLVDFGSQLYIPWRLAEGTPLYYGIDYKEGPLSQYLNALLFVLFGVSLRTLIWANLVLLAVLCGLVYVIVARACDRPTATLVVMVQLGVFSFSQYTGIGNYNYVCPYAPEQTHGILLAVLMLFALGESAERGSRVWSVVAGVALGCIFLTKSELFVPAAGAGLLGLVLIAFTVGPATASGHVLLPFVVAAVVPPAVALLLLWAQMPFAWALQGMLGNWFHLRSGILDYKFYREGMGLEDPVGNLKWSLELFFALATTVAAASTATWALRKLRRAQMVVAVVGGVAVLATLVALPDLIPWRQLGRPLPFTTAVILAILVWRSLACRYRSDGVRRAVVPAMWAALSLLLLTKVLLNVRISHYGFVLAMPATLLLVATLAWGVPAYLQATLGSGAVARALLVSPVLAGVVYFLSWSNTLYAAKTLPVGEGGDVLMAPHPTADPRGYGIGLAATRLRSRMPSDATLLVIPEGIILNYWLRRVNPSRHVYFVPWSLEFAGGESAVLREISARPPDYVVVTHREAGESDYGFFGADPRYGGQIMQWVRANYRRIDRIGAEPLTDGRFGIVILEYASDWR